MTFIWGIQLGMHDYIYANGGPYGTPRYGDAVTYVAPGVWFGWRF